MQNHISQKQKKMHKNYIADVHHKTVVKKERKKTPQKSEFFSNTDKNRNFYFFNLRKVGNSDKVG